jgi:hypothetical protein
MPGAVGCRVPRSRRRRRAGWRPGTRTENRDRGRVSEDTTRGTRKMRTVQPARQWSLWLENDYCYEQINLRRRNPKAAPTITAIAPAVGPGTRVTVYVVFTTSF